MLAACSSTTSAAPAAVAAATHPPCTSTLQTWADGPGGQALHAVLSAGTAMGAALESGSKARVSGVAGVLDSAAIRADDHLPPVCADRDAAYKTAMQDWLTGAADARNGNLEGTSAKIATGAHVIDAVALLQRLSPALLKGLSRQVPIPTHAAPPPAPPTPPAPAPAATTAAPPAAPAPATTPAAATSASCYPLSDEGTCYEPGEYCRDDDHGSSGVAGDGEAITCEDNDGWRWEPS
jgi:hypothetical protein